MERRETIYRIILLAPVVTIFSVFVLWPLLNSFRYSVTNWNGVADYPDFIGLANFDRIFTDADFYTATINTAIWMVAALFLPTLAGLGLALFLNSGVSGGGIFKSIFYLPICLSSVIVGQIWIWIYQPNWGLLNTIIQAATGNRRFNFAWLAQPSTALGSVIVAWSWQQTGLAMVIFLAGLTSIPRTCWKPQRSMALAAGSKPCISYSPCCAPRPWWL